MEDAPTWIRAIVSLTQPGFRFRLGGKHWHHVGGGTGRGPWWLACTVGRRPVWLGFGTVI